MRPKRRWVAVIAVAAVISYAAVHSAGHPGHHYAGTTTAALCVVLVAFVAASLRFLSGGQDSRPAPRNRVAFDGFPADRTYAILRLAPTLAHLQRFRK